MIRACLDLGNVSSVLLKDNLVVSLEAFEAFQDLGRGIPILVPADKALFEFEKSDVFEIHPDRLLEAIFSLTEKSYIGFKLSFSTNKFLKRFSVKPDFRAQVESVKSQNLEVLSHVARMRDKHGTVGAFQTRNIPHLGHEKIISMMLDHCKHLVINPVVGSKKPGDIKIQNLKEVFEGIISKKFFGRVSFQPIYANMYYAGPREAVHHAIMRRNLGFTHFSVGRDHAGADGVYPEDQAPTLVRNKQGYLGIEVLTHDGAYFCNECNKTVLKGQCSHDVGSLSSISGSEFRKHLINGTVYELADLEVQRYLSEISEKLFEE